MNEIPLRAPRYSGFRYLGTRNAGTMPDGRPYIARLYQRGDLLVISSFDPVWPPSWHISASRRIGRPSDDDMDLVRSCFDMQDAEEDSEGCAGVRHLFMAVDLADFQEVAGE